MAAIFKVKYAFPLTSRSLFVFAGKVIQGAVERGMSIHISLNEDATMDVPVQGVDVLRRDGDELVALTVAIEDQSDADFLQQFDVVGESLTVLDET
ncbi:hypothetical protein ASE35_05695 [Lysobacter sp. Root916]|uniref:hypothetical protein n=1 Tax=Lysobacter sp. Root916 TaxID=1736606 RepID=UPI00070BE0DE|nr:hypothetical protein [Lysobacter sp. Root916]KRD39814.1 hypothetical protein ASE35_05695 [Lysobacter sp. Root916]